MDEVQLSDIIFNIRYRLNNDPNWKYSRSRETRAMLALEDFKHGDEIRLQIQAERAGVIIEDWGQELVANIGTKLHLSGAVEKDGKNGVSVDPQDLLPPLDFTARVVGPSSVKLEWKPNEGVPQDIFYVVNIKQLTSSAPPDAATSLQRQQVHCSLDPSLIPSA
ncbi:hypothetical protein WR25_03705 [Diploscapter pachys]|uniref:Fibronectin type-III domain-containing protein n=1 Tax=Diploscapter pachys TaxID=2018661 RepID=A0A2A2LP48_9BILA|nr:hypothetical protein WR25_03705 [Diploscapter pachys]